jgi:hypothetical protein
MSALGGKRTFAREPRNDCFWPKVDRLLCEPVRWKRTFMRVRTALNLTSPSNRTASRRTLAGSGNLHLERVSKDVSFDSGVACRMSALEHPLSVIVQTRQQGAAVIGGIWPSTRGTIIAAGRRRETIMISILPISNCSYWMIMVVNGGEMPRLQRAYDGSGQR